MRDTKEKPVWCLARVVVSYGNLVTTMFQMLFALISSESSSNYDQQRRSEFRFDNETSTKCGRMASTFLSLAATLENQITSPRRKCSRLSAYVRRRGEFYEFVVSRMQNVDQPESWKSEIKVQRVTYLSQISFGIITSSFSSQVLVAGLSWLIRLRLLAKYLKIVSSSEGLSPSKNSCSLRRTRWLQIISVCFGGVDLYLTDVWTSFLFLVYCVSTNSLFEMFWSRPRISWAISPLWELFDHTRLPVYESHVSRSLTVCCATSFSPKSFQRISCAAVFLCCCFHSIEIFTFRRFLSISARGIVSNRFYDSKFMNRLINFLTYRDTNLLKLKFFRFFTKYFLFRWRIYFTKFQHFR